MVLLSLTTDDFAVLDLYEELPRLFTRAKIEAVGEGGAALRCWKYLPTARVIRP